MTVLPRPRRTFSKCEPETRSAVDQPPQKRRVGEVTATGPTAKPVLVISRASDTAAGDDQFRLKWDELDTTQDGNGEDESASAIDNYSLQWKSSRSAGTADTTDWPDDGTDSGPDTQVEAEGTVDDGGEYEAIHSVIFTNTPLLPGATLLLPRPCRSHVAWC